MESEKYNKLVNIIKMKQAYRTNYWLLVGWNNGGVGEVGGANTGCKTGLRIHCTTHRMSQHFAITANESNL